MDLKAHCQQLEQLYKSAPVNNIYRPQITVTHTRCEIRQTINQQHFHGGNALHGSVLFKLLDDASFFAVQSAVMDKFIVTSSFTIQFVRPVMKGELKAVGEVLMSGRNLFHAEAKVYDERNKLVASGTGTFVKSKMDLEELVEI